MAKISKGKKIEKIDHREMDLERCAASLKLIEAHLQSIDAYLKDYASSDKSAPEAKSKRKKIETIVKALEGSISAIDKLDLNKHASPDITRRAHYAILHFKQRLESIATYFALPQKEEKFLAKLTRSIENVSRSLAGLELPRARKKN